MLRGHRPIQSQVNEYLEYCERERRLSEQTMSSKRYIVRRFASDTKVKDIRSLTNDQLNEWRITQVESGVSPSTVNTRMHHVIAFLRYLEAKKEPLKVKIGLLKELPTDPTDTLFFTAEEVVKLKEACAGLRDHLIISLAFESGLRLTELTSLKVDNFTGLQVTTRAKGRKLRKTFILEETRRNLDKWLSLNDISEGWIFPSPTKFGAHLHTDQVRYIMKKVFAQAGLEGTPHALRHSFATNLLRNGADIFTVSELIGHSDPKTTKGYIHILGDELAKKHQEFMKYK